MKPTEPVRELVTTFPGRCFRYVDADNGHTRRCPNQTVCTGTFTDRTGKRWTVDACAEHAGELSSSDRMDAAPRPR